MHRQVVPTRDSTPRAMGPHGEAWPTVGEEYCVGLVASALWEQVLAAEVVSALAVGAAVLCSPVTVGSPPPTCSFRSPPVIIGADLAEASFTFYLLVVVGLNVLNGFQKPPDWAEDQ